MKAQALIIVPMLTAVVGLFPMAARGADCAPGEAHYRAGRFLDAEREARKCLKGKQERRATWFLLSRALGGQKRYPEALRLAEQALKHHPLDQSLRTWRVRLLAWQGKLDRAWQEAQRFEPVARKDRETTKLLADLAFWRKDFREAAKRYGSYLDQWPDDSKALRSRGIAYVKLKREKQAARDFEKLCHDSPSGDGCRLLGASKRRSSRFSLLLQPSFQMLEERSDWWQFKARLEARVWKSLVLGFSTNYVNRAYSAGKQSDTFLEGSARYRFGKRFGLGVAAGGTVAPDFLPRYTFQVEPWVLFDFGLQVFLRYWRLGFENKGVNVVNPHLTWYIGPFALDVRYYMSINDSGDLGHTVWGKLSFFHDRWVLYAGGGGGTSSDYLEVPNANVNSFWMLVAGLGFKLNWRHWLVLEYLHRNEKADTEHFRMHQLLIGYQIRF